MSITRTVPTRMYDSMYDPVFVTSNAPQPAYSSKANLYRDQAKSVTLTLTPNPFLLNLSP